MKELHDKFRGAILGLAIGDALGHPTEFMSRSAIVARWGPGGVTDFEAAGRHPAGTYTDDTQMSIAVAEGLLAAGRDASIEAQMRAIADEFVRWSRAPDNDRAPGRTCMTGCQNLALGAPWHAAGVATSKGCGSAMRVAPIGLMFAGDLARLVPIARASSLLTHGHRAALDAAEACALGVALALRGCGADELAAAVSAVERSPDFTQAMQRYEAFRDAPAEVALSRVGLGEAWVAEEAFVSALYCFARFPDDFAACVLCGANTDGDSDSIAAIAGSFAGARLGASAIPSRWRAGVENAAALERLADRLFDTAMAASSEFVSA